jgi:hypothetical protein
MFRGMDAIKDQRWVENIERLKDAILTAPDESEAANRLKQWIENTRKLMRESGMPEAAVLRYGKDVARTFGFPDIDDVDGYFEQITEARKRQFAAQASAAKNYHDTLINIEQTWGRIVRIMAVNVMNSPLGRGLKTLETVLDKWERVLMGRAPSGEKLLPPAKSWWEQLNPFDPRNVARERQVASELQMQPAWPTPQGPAPGSTVPGMQGMPQPLMSTGGVAGFTGPYAPMRSWRAAADWASQLSGTPSTNIERRDLVEDQNDQTRRLVNEMRRANALLSGEEQPAGQALGLLSTQMGGLGPGMGTGQGVGGVPPMGTLPGFPRGGGPRGPGGTTLPPELPSIPSGTGRTYGGPITLPSGWPALGPGGTPLSYGGRPITDLRWPGGAPVTPMPGTGDQVAWPRSPFAAGGPSTGAFTPSRAGGRDPNVVKAIVEEWRAAGMSDAGIAGVLANIQSESNFNPTLRHPDQPHFSGEAHYAHGLYQEGGDEWNHYVRWFQQNHPGADWRDPRLQSRFAAQNLRQNYPRVWERMQQGSKELAAEAYVRGYLKPALQYQASRSAQYRRGVPGIEAYGTTSPTGGPSVEIGPLQIQGQPAGTGGAGGAGGRPGTGTGVDKVSVVGKGGGADPRLYEIAREASKTLPEGWRVEIYSGLAARSTGTNWHPTGRAIDVRLIDPTGRQISNYQNPATFRTYEDFAMRMRAAQQRLHPEMNQSFRWGGYFGGGRDYMDLMHFDTGPTGLMAAGDWTSGLHEDYRRRWGVSEPSHLGAQAAPQTAGGGAVSNLMPSEQAQIPGGRIDMDRSLIDTLAARRMRARRALGGANIDVTVSNKGQQSVSQIGPFRKVKIARAVQMHKAETGPVEPPAATGEAHDPSLDS